MTIESSSEETALKDASRPPLSPEVEGEVGITSEDLAAIYVLDSIKGFGPQKFKHVHEQGIRFIEVVSDPTKLPIKGKRGDEFRNEISKNAEGLLATCRARAERQIGTAHRLGAAILSYFHPLYPVNVYASNNPVPVLYIRGRKQLLKHQRIVACVGSRQIRLPYRDLHELFARTACEMEITVASGFATGADAIGHTAARNCGGTTICCMPGGLDRPFPPENRAMWDDFLKYDGAVLVSEFPFGARTSSLTLRKRNKLIVAFARGVLISQSSATGGAMNAYRFAREQKKPVATFAGNGAADVSGNELIVKEQVEGDALFPLAPRPDEYKQWLRALCSST